MIRALVVALMLAAVGCTAANRDLQMRVLNVASQASNEAEQSIVVAYRLRMQKCLEDAFTRVDYDVCVSEVDHVYTRIRLDWDALRRTQDEFATALEHGTYKAEDYKEWFRMTYCNLVEGLPSEIRLPPVPGLSCTSRSNPDAQ